MFETLRKMGVPLTVAAALGAVVTTTPLLFTIDERYAKASDVKEQMAQLQNENQALRMELSRLVGFQSAMVTFIQEGRIPQPTRPASIVEEPQPTRMRSARPIVGAVPPPPPPPPVMTEEPAAESAPVNVPPARNWDDLKSRLAEQEQRLNQ